MTAAGCGMARDVCRDKVNVRKRGQLVGYKAKVARWRGMYDLHCHILPSLDDGPSSLDDAVSMARVAAMDGIVGTVVTPHGDAVEAAGGKDELERRLNALRAEMARAGVKLQLMAGAEHKLRPELVESLVQGRAPRLNGSRYVLVELDFVNYAPYTEEVVFQLRLRGFTPVLAHPERQEVLQRDPMRVRGLAEQGVVLQLTAGSLEGAFGEGARRAAETMLKEGLAHLLASDAHGATGSRPPVMSRGAMLARKLVGDKGMELLVHENPAAILEDRGVVSLERRPSRSFWPVRRGR